MVQTENAEWEEFSALLDEAVHDTNDSGTEGTHYAGSASQAYYAQHDLEDAHTQESDDDLVEVDIDQFTLEPQAEMEAESGTTAQHHSPTYEALAAGPVVVQAPVELSSGSSSTATTRSAGPQSEAAANRLRATQKGYLARRRAARKSASLQTAKKEVASQAGSMTPHTPSTGDEIPAPRVSSPTATLPGTRSAAAVAVAHTAALPQPQTGSQKSDAPAPTSVSTPSQSSSSALAIPTPSSSHAATGPATLPPPPPLPVGPAGRRQLWEADLKLGLPHLKAGYRIALPPARPASAPVVGATSAGPVPQVGARHQSAPVASTSREKRSRDEEDRGERVVRKRAKATNLTTQSQQQRQPPVSSSIRAPRPQWIPYSAQQPGESRQREHLLASHPTGLPAQTQQQIVSSHQGKQMHRISPPAPTAPPSTSTSQGPMQMSSTARYIDVAGRQAPNAMAPQRSFERPMQPIPVAGPSRRPYEQEQGDSSLQHLRSRPVNAQTHAMPQAAVPRTFARTESSTSRGAGQSIVLQQPLQATPEAGPSRAAYQQPYNRAGVQRLYDQPASPQSYMMPVPSGWNDPSAVPRTFGRAQTSASAMQTEGQATYRRVQDAPAAYTARPQHQMARPAPPMYGGGMAPGAEQLPSLTVGAPGSQPVYNQPYAPPIPAGWNSSAQLQAMSMSAGETVPAYLTMYAPPNYPPPGWSPQAPVYEEEPRARGQGSMSSAYGYEYDF